MSRASAANHTRSIGSYRTPADVAAQHRVLVPGHQQFSVLRQGFTECQDSQAEYPAN
jgi:hypothetical protein